MPFPTGPLLAYLGRRLVPGLEEVAPASYTRRVEGGLLSVVWEGTDEPRVAGPGRGATEDEERRLDRLFRFSEPWITPEPLARDPLIGALAARVPGYRPLGCWDPFELCVRTVVGQQVSVAAAGTLMARVGRQAGGWHPGALAAADLTGLGMPGRRAATLNALGQHAAEGRLPWGAPWPDLREELARVPGLGPWTLDYLGIRLGRDLDALPLTDLGLLRAVGARSPRELEARAHAWRPWRGWAAAYLWMS